MTNLQDNATFSAESGAATTNDSILNDSATSEFLDSSSAMLQQKLEQYEALVEQVFTDFMPLWRGHSDKLREIWRKAEKEDDRTAGYAMAWEFKQLMIEPFPDPTPLYLANHTKLKDIFRESFGYSQVLYQRFDMNHLQNRYGSYLTRQALADNNERIWQLREKSKALFLVGKSIKETAEEQLYYIAAITAVGLHYSKRRHLAEQYLALPEAERAAFFNEHHMEVFWQDMTKVHAELSQDEIRTVIRLTQIVLEYYESLVQEPGVDHALFNVLSFHEKYKRHELLEQTRQCLLDLGHDAPNQKLQRLCKLLSEYQTLAKLEQGQLNLHDPELLAQALELLTQGYTS